MCHETKCGVSMDLTAAVPQWGVFGQKKRHGTKKQMKRDKISNRMSGQKKIASGTKKTQTGQKKTTFGTK